MARGRVISIPKWRRIKDGSGIGAGNRKLLKRYILRAESLCTDPTFRADVEAARNAWNNQHPSFTIDPDYPRESKDRTLGHVSLANALEYALKNENREDWSSLQPTVIDWFDCLAGLHILAFPPVVYDTGFAAVQAIGITFIETFLLQGPRPLKGNCSQCFPPIQEIYETFARRIVANGSCLPIDANSTAEDMKDFARYALPIIRSSTNTGETFIGLAIHGLTTGGFDRGNIAFRLGLNPRTVKEWLRSQR